MAYSPGEGPVPFTVGSPTTDAPQVLIVFPVLRRSIPPLCQRYRNESRDRSPVVLVSRISIFDTALIITLTRPSNFVISITFPPLLGAFRPEGEAVAN